MEGGWVTGQHPFNTDAKAYVTKGDVRRGEYADSKEAGVNMMDFRVGETEIWFNETFNLVKFAQVRRVHGFVTKNPVDTVVPGGLETARLVRELVQHL